MIQEQAKTIKRNILKDVYSLELIKLNPVEHLKVAELITKKLKALKKDAVYEHVLNQIREDKEKLYETGKYS